MHLLPVLLVDDETLVQELLKDALADAGYEVITADDGHAAFALLEQRATELAGLVTDISMGSGPTGWDVARRGRELNLTLPVVYVSGDSAHDWAVKGVPHSVMVQKPFANSQIVVALAELAIARSGDL